MEVFNITTELYPQTMKLSDDTFRHLSDFVYKQSGILIGESQKYLLESRLINRIKTVNLSSFEAYLEALRNKETYEKEKHFLFDAVTISESSFFRDIQQTQALRDVVLPMLFDNLIKTGRKGFRILSAGCAAGEEPYSLAMVLLEHFDSFLSRLTTKILAIDISQKNLERAHEARYREFSIKNAPEEYLRKYFVQQGGMYQVKKNIRKMIEFRIANLIDPVLMAELGKFDLILCRNVLIYMDRSAKIQVVKTLYDMLNSPGYFFIGQSESLHGISQAFKLQLFNKAIGYKKE